MFLVTDGFDCFNQELRGRIHCYRERNPTSRYVCMCLCKLWPNVYFLCSQWSWNYFLCYSKFTCHPLNTTRKICLPVLFEKSAMYKTLLCRFEQSLCNATYKHWKLNMMGVVFTSVNSFYPFPYCIVLRLARRNQSNDPSSYYFNRWKSNFIEY